MSAEPALERRYRRLLAWYPAGHRATYGEEMIGVLLAVAPDGRRRPGLADTIDLVRGAALTRLRNVRNGRSTASDWRDSLALYSLLAPFLAALIASTTSGANLSRAWWFDPYLLSSFAGPPAGNLAPIVHGISGLAALFLPLILGWLGLRRLAALATGALLAWVTVVSLISNGLPLTIWDIGAPSVVVLQACLALQIIALLASPGPRRGGELFTPKGCAIAMAWIGTGVLVALHQFHKPMPLAVIWLALLGLAATLALANARRLLLLLAIPASPLLVSVTAHYGAYLLSDYSARSTIFWLCLAPILTAATVFLIARPALNGRRAPSPREGSTA